MASAPTEAHGHGTATTRSVPGLLVERAKSDPGAVALRHKHHGRWVPTTWLEHAEQVARVAAGLRGLGVGDGDRVAIVSDNSPEWLVTDLAIQALGASSIGIDPGIDAAGLGAALERAAAVVAVAEDEEQYDKVAEVRADLGALRTLVIIDPRGITLDPSQPDTMTLAQLEETATAATVDTLAADLARVTPGHVATIVAGGAGAGEVRLTHADLIVAADAAASALELDRSTEVLSYLPLALPAERVVSLVAAMATGFVVCFGDGGDTFLTDMQQVQPTFLLGVPLVFEQLHTTVERRMEDASFLKRKTYSFWMARGRRLGEARRQGRAGIVGRLLHGVGWVALYRPLRLKLGLLRVRGALCAPGTDDPAVLDYFWALGVPVRVGHDPTGSADGFLPTASTEARPSTGARMDQS